MFLLTFPVTKTNASFDSFASINSTRSLTTVIIDLKAPRHPLPTSGCSDNTKDSFYKRKNWNKKWLFYPDRAVSTHKTEKRPQKSAIFLSEICFVWTSLNKYLVVTGDVSWQLQIKITLLVTLGFQTEPGYLIFWKLYGQNVYDMNSELKDIFL